MINPWILNQLGFIDDPTFQLLCISFVCMLGFGIAFMFGWYCIDKLVGWFRS
jgi:hypothetical protein